MNAKRRKVIIINPYYSDQKITASNACFRELFSTSEPYIKNYTFITDQLNLPSWMNADDVNHVVVKSPFPLFRRFYFYVYVSIYLILYRADIVFSEFNPLPITALLSRNVWLRIYHVEQNLYSRRGKLKEIGLRTYLRMYYLLSIFFKKYRIVTISESSKRDIEKFRFADSSNIHISYCGVKSEALSNYINESTKLSDYCYDLIYVGTFSERKNVDLIPQALSKIRKSLRVLIIGKDLGTKARVVAKCIDSCPHHKFEIIEDLTDEQIMNCYAKSAMFVTASLHEGFGMPVVEAACLGMPVICSNLDVFKELNQDAHFFTSNDADSFAKTVQRCITGFDAIKRESLYKSQTYLKLFDWKNHTENLLQKLVHD